MKKLIFYSLILLCSVAYGQDTIRTKAGLVIPCKLERADAMNVYYNTGAGTKEIEKRLISTYSINGYNHTMPILNNQQPVSPVTYRNKVEEAGVSLQRFHGQYMGGTITSLSGIAIGIIGGLSLSPAITYTGLGVSLVGAIITIDSFKHVKRCGLSLSEAGLKYTF